MNAIQTLKRGGRSIGVSIIIAVLALISSAGALSAASASADSTVPPVGSYVQPGTVGYLGLQSALTVYQPGGLTPSGCSWQSYGLRCNQTNLTFDHVEILGGLYWNGTGNLTIQNSIVEGGLSWYAVYAASSTNVAGATVTVTDSTVSWEPGLMEPTGSDVGAISVNGTQSIIAERNDISDMPQGIDTGNNSVGNSIIEDNWIHDLVQNGTAANPSHMDGIFVQHGNNILIQQNYVDTPARSDTTAALFIQNRGVGTNAGIQIYANYLNGGAYNLRNQTGINVDVQNNTFGSSLYGFVGDLTGYAGTYGTWYGNVDRNGVAISRP